MAGRGRTTFQKRLKEQVRLERRAEKAARKLARKASKEGRPADPDFAAAEPDGLGSPGPATPEQ